MWLKHPMWVTGFTTVVLVIYTLLAYEGSLPRVVMLIFSVSPFLVCWLVYTVIRFGIYNGPQLKENQEWGYQDGFQYPVNLPSSDSE